MNRFVFAIFMCLLAAAAAFAKPPKRSAIDLNPAAQAVPGPRILEVPNGLAPLWQAKWWGHKPSSTQLRCAEGTDLGFVVPATLAKGWGQPRLYKWLAPLASALVPAGAVKPVTWFLARSVLAPRQVTAYCIRPIITGSDNPVFRWSFGTQTVYTDAATSGGPRALGMEFWAAIQLQLWQDWLRFRMEFSPGYTWSVAGEKGGSFSLSEFAALEFKTREWLWLTVGVRHRVAFNAESDNFNALLAEVGARFRIWSSLDVGLSISLGGAWFPIYEIADPATVPYWLDKPPPVVRAASGFTGGFALSVGWQF